jgi:hypothetical protein
MCPALLRDLVWEAQNQWQSQYGRGAVVEREEVAMLKSYHGLGLRLLWYWERYPLSLVKQEWSKWASSSTR